MTVEQLADAIQLALYRVADNDTDDQGRPTHEGRMLRWVADELADIMSKRPEQK